MQLHTGCVPGTHYQIISGSEANKDCDIFSCCSVVNISFCVLGMLYFLGVIGRDKLYCSSEDVLETLEHPTIYCWIQGKVITEVMELKKKNRMITIATKSTQQQIAESKAMHLHD